MPSTILSECAVSHSGNFGLGKQSIRCYLRTSNMSYMANRLILTLLLGTRGDMALERADGEEW